jgi:hypothetical protein
MTNLLPHWSGMGYNPDMTVQLTLPKDVEQRLLAEVQAGRHASLEEAILEKLSRKDDPDLLAATGMQPEHLRKDLDEAWSNRAGAVDGESAFARISDKSDSLKAKGL